MKLTGYKDITGRLICDGDTLTHPHIEGERLVVGWSTAQEAWEAMGETDTLLSAGFSKATVVHSRDLPSPKGRIA